MWQPRDRQELADLSTLSEAVERLENALDQSDPSPTEKNNEALQLIEQAIALLLKR